MTFLEQILLTIVTASATAILAYFGFWRQAKAELEKEYAKKFNEKKWEIYIQFMELVTLIRQVSEDKLNQKEAESDSSNFLCSQNDLISNGEYFFQKLEIDTNEDELHDRLQNIEEKLLLIASSETVKRYLIWKEYAESNPIFEDEKGTRVFLDLVNTMREDLGNINSNLNLNDFDGIYFVSEEKKKEYAKWRQEQHKKRLNKTNREQLT